MAVTQFVAGCQPSEGRGAPREAGTPDSPSETTAHVAACRKAFAEGLGVAPDAAPVSFRRDLMPLFANRCNHGGCHIGEESADMMQLGEECSFDPFTVTCTFDAGGQPQELLQRVHDNLLSLSNAAPKLRRVEPGDLSRSFILMKLSACQNAFAEDTGCERCGQPMPPSAPLRDNAPEVFALIATWIAQGATLD